MAPITYHLSGVEGEGIHENIIDTWAVRSCPVVPRLFARKLELLP